MRIISRALFQKNLSPAKFPVVFSLLTAGVATVGLQASDLAPLQLEQAIPLPGVKGKFDHLAIDLSQGRIFIAAKINNTLEVDLKNGRRVRSVTGFS